MTATEVEGCPLPGGKSVWMVSRKHPPAVGGMEMLSAKVVEEVGKVAPVTAIVASVGPRGLLWFIPKAAILLLGGLVARRVSILHLHDPVLAVLGWLARPFGVPVVVTLHGLDVCFSNPIYQSYFRSLARSFAAYVCISGHVAALAAKAGIAPGKLHVVPIGIETPPPPRASADLRLEAVIAGPTGRITPYAKWVAPPTGSSQAPPRPPLPGNARLAVTVGRLVARKGVRWFVSEVFPSLARRFPDLHYVVVGTGPEERVILQAIESRNLRSRVHLLGVVSDAERWGLLRRAAIVAMPNVPVRDDAEGFGVTALEAAVAGRPLVAADLEGLRDSVIACRTGIRVTALDAPAWIAVVTRLLERRSLAEALGRRARRTALATFDWRTIAHRYCDVYRAIL